MMSSSSLVAAALGASLLVGKAPGTGEGASDARRLPPMLLRLWLAAPAMLVRRLWVAERLPARELERELKREARPPSPSLPLLSFSSSSSLSARLSIARRLAMDIPPTLAPSCLLCALASLRAAGAALRATSLRAAPAAGCCSDGAASSLASSSSASSSSSALPSSSSAKPTP